MRLVEYSEGIKLKCSATVAVSASLVRWKLHIVMVSPFILSGWQSGPGFESGQQWKAICTKTEVTQQVA